MNIAMYIRLSLADEDTGFSKTESNSIVSQRMCLHSFLDKDLSLAKLTRIEFVDDGFTATNGNRPNFQKMMEQVQAGEIKLIIVRDFSRFFRDYIEAGNYLECVFPFLGVRFISINDNYDSDDYKGSTGGLEMVMRNIIYASYSKDLSIKTRASKELMMKQGKYVGSTPPYGYIMYQAKRNKLAVDEVVAHIVKRIFEEATQGKTVVDIVRGLNADNVPTPTKRFRENYPNNNKFKKSTLSVWNYMAIYNTFQNLVYTGTLVSHRRKKESLSSKKTIAQEPIIVEGTHEAIITREMFDKAQQAIRKATGKKVIVSYDYPLKSIVKCGNCKRTLTRRIRDMGNLYTCTYNLTGSIENCKDKRMTESKLEEITYNAIAQYVSLLEDKTVVSEGGKANTLNVMTELSLLDSQVDSLKSYKIRLYENYTGGEITKEMFIKQKADVDIKIEDCNKAKLELKEKMKSSQTEKSVNSKTNNLISIFSKDNKLTHEMAHAFIKAIYVHSENNIEIEWKFKDKFMEV